MAATSYSISYKTSYLALNITFINTYTYEDIFVGCSLKKIVSNRGHYFVFCAGVGILTTPSDHNFASNFFYVAWTHSIHVICDIDHWQKKVVISQDVFICEVHYSNVITGNLFLLTYYNYSHFFFIPDIVYIDLIS